MACNTCGKTVMKSPTPAGNNRLAGHTPPPPLTPQVTVRRPAPLVKRNPR